MYRVNVLNCRGRKRSHPIETMWDVVISQIRWPSLLRTNGVLAQSQCYFSVIYRGSSRKILRSRLLLKICSSHRGLSGY